MNQSKITELKEAAQCIVISWGLTALSIIVMLGLLYACATELPKAMDAEQSAYQARVMARCVRHGDYNMGDAFCVAAANEKGQ